MRLYLDESELPDDLPVHLAGVIIKGADNKLFGWFGGGRAQKHIKCEVIVENPTQAEWTKDGDPE